ncbi:MAG TPA: PQQ-binding-like beta-propeller repeat protein, partial [Gemmataceae bacterium]|nr:PQQ-binding-like beta-propeller repeat protein [Gemmataceae bacterium]
IPTDWSYENGKKKNVLWVAKVGSKAYGGPVVLGDKVFIGTNNESPRNPAVKGSKGIVMCFNAGDGKFLWQAAHDELPAQIVKDARGEGIASTPAVEGNRVYYVNNRCEVICADAAGNGGTQEAKIIWRLDMMKDLDVFPHKLPNCSPLVAGDLLFITTGNGTDEEEVKNPKAPSFIAVDKKTGTVKWKDNSPGDKVIMGQWSNPAYAVVNGKAQVIFGGGDGWLRAFEAETGQPLWRFDCNPKNAKAKGNRDSKNYLVGTPVVYENKVYVGVGQEPSLGSGVGHLWCIDITKTGDVSPVNDIFDPKAEVNKKSALAWHYGGPADAKTAEETGSDSVFGRTVSTCAVYDGLVYAAEVAGFLHCVDAKTGKRYWVHDLKADVWGSPYFVDGKVYIGTGDGDIHIFAHGKDKKTFPKVEMGNAVYSTPVAVNGVLFVLTMKDLVAIKQ